MIVHQPTDPYCWCPSCLENEERRDMARKKRTEWRVTTRIDYFNHSKRFDTEAEARTWVLNAVGPSPKLGTVTVEEVEVK